MRGCVIGGVVLAVVVILVTVNAVFVGNTVEELTGRVRALPAIPDPAKTPEEIAAIRELLSSKETLLGLSVSHEVTDRITEALYGLEAAAETEDLCQYRESLTL